MLSGTENRLTGNRHSRMSSMGSFLLNPFSPGRERNTTKKLRSISSMILSRTHPISLPNSLQLEREEPTSPKVGCMGQIKLQQYENNGVIKRGGARKIAKRLKKMFSGKGKQVEDGQAIRFCGGDCAKEERLCVSLDMDPPLPVVTRVGDHCTISLWKRRCDSPLKALHLKVSSCGRR